MNFARLTRNQCSTRAPTKVDPPNFPAAIDADTRPPGWFPVIQYRRRPATTNYMRFIAPLRAVYDTNVHACNFSLLLTLFRVSLQAAQDQSAISLSLSNMTRFSISAAQVRHDRFAVWKNLTAGIIVVTREPHLAVLPRLALSRIFSFFFFFDSSRSRSTRASRD